MEKRMNPNCVNPNCANRVDVRLKRKVSLRRKVSENANAFVLVVVDRDVKYGNELDSWTESYATRDEAESRMYAIERELTRDDVVFGVDSARDDMMVIEFFPRTRRTMTII